MGRRGEAAGVGKRQMPTEKAWEETGEKIWRMRTEKGQGDDGEKKRKKVEKGRCWTEKGSQNSRETGEGSALPTESQGQPAPLPLLPRTQGPSGKSSENSRLLARALELLLLPRVLGTRASSLLSLPSHSPGHPCPKEPQAPVGREDLGSDLKQTPPP